jgi:transposase
MKILAIDLGKYKSVFVVYQNNQAQYGKVATEPGAIGDLLVEQGAGSEGGVGRLVIEAGAAAGWVSDLGRSLGMEVQVANVNDQRWKWQAVKSKSDRADALKLAIMSQMGTLPTVHVPEASVRQWRSLIEYRHGVVDRRTSIKNCIRAIFQRQGLSMPSGPRAWTEGSLAQFKAQSTEVVSGACELWRFQLHCELEALEQVQKQLDQIEAQLAELARENQRVKLLKTAPYVGPRLSEAVVAIVDDPRRFKSGRQVGNYAGLTPKRWQSGQSERQGPISRCGNGLLRELLVEVAWLGVNHNTWMKQVYEQIRRGSEKRKKIAIVAVARRLLVRLWAMLRDGTAWKELDHPLGANPPGHAAVVL